MCKISVKVLPDFRGDTVVLAAFDAAGLQVLRDGLMRAQDAVPALIPCICGKQEHVITIGSQQSTVDLRDDRVTWTLAADTKDEIVAKLNALDALGKPAHHYVDISGEVATLVLSRDEYI